MGSSTSCEDDSAECNHDCFVSYVLRLGADLGSVFSGVKRRRRLLQESRSVDSFKASGTPGSSGTVTVAGELELPALAALPQHDCHIEVQVTERVRGHCSALTLLGKSFPVCKNGDRISVNNHECAHMAA
nr:uncharacterized protein LOC119169646 [Rhipicephalus microplus]